MITILAMGQSNALGYGMGGPWVAPAFFEVWDNEGGRNDLLNVGGAWVQPTLSSAPFSSGGHNNMMAHAAHWIAKATGQQVRLVLVSMNGQEISQWVDANAVKGPMYARMMAVVAAAGVSAVDVFLWQQGESDNTVPSTYAQKWANLMNAMEADGIITSSTKVVVGEPSPKASAILPVIRQLDAGQVKVAPTSALATLSDLIHFTGPSLAEAGRLLGQKAYSMTTTPEFSAIKNASQSIPSATSTRVTFQQTAWATGLAFDHFNSQVTPPAGRYRISAGVQVTGMTVGKWLILYVVKNGCALKKNFIRADNSLGMVCLTCDDYASGTDVYELQVYAEGAPVIAFTQEGTWFQMAQS